MKTAKILILFAFALLFAFGCQKQESAPAADQQTTKTIDVWLFNSEDGSVVQKTIDVNDLQSNSASNDLKQTNSAHTHGSYSNESRSVTWSGTQNNGGTHGSAIVTLNFADPAIVLTLETACVMVEGNEAVYGGTITEAVNVPEGESYFEVGGHFLFKVIDNGQGHNAPPDQYSNIIAVFNGCGFMVPSEWIWGLGGYGDVEAPGSVKVN